MTQTTTDKEIEKICKGHGIGYLGKCYKCEVELISSKKDAEWKEVVEGLKKDRQEAIDQYCKVIAEIKNIRDIAEMRGNLIENLGKSIKEKDAEIKEFQSKLENSITKSEVLTILNQYKCGKHKKLKQRLKP